MCRGVLIRLSPPCLAKGKAGPLPAAVRRHDGAGFESKMIGDNALNATPTYVRSTTDTYSVQQMLPIVPLSTYGYKYGYMAPCMAISGLPCDPA